MAAFVLDDSSGTAEVVVFPEAFSKYATLVGNDTMVLVRGKLEKDDESTRLIAVELLSITAMRERIATEVAVRLSVPPHGRQTFEALADALARHGGDRPVVIEVELRDREPPVLVRADIVPRVRPSERLVAEVEQVCGIGSIVLR